ncbi:MAG: hypothetical protein KF870_05725 [Leadbetterella sp.]|nr:hypothetical protein [Leadbetterella sp.]
MLETKILQESENGITHVLLNGPLGFEAQVPKGRLYVEFDIPANVIRGGIISSVVYVIVYKKWFIKEKNNSGNFSN